ncbi:alpha/beta fold hydrolase [Kitasatospora cathayae]|uniref:Alpha/beta fold hydrolase n=1 Tax=Kitasatospora cathayae TaxID=3004092 RepID=A0ABY7QD54_9ACTN|nr:alpha/beta fold hydrolase [Kitasatospora sp. HUAS 3-15]WBP90532.1 alpha/beta fold hydrolase [Kitasatospora sp. HUAS 3-15]
MGVDTDRPTFLLVHGAWHGAWCWDAVRTALDADGWRSRAIDLPSSHPPVDRPDGARPVGMLDDADAIRASLRSIGGPAVVIAHSYGGVPVTEAIADAPNAVLAVYLAAFQLDAGESMSTFLGTPVPDDGTGQAPPYPDSRRILFDDVPGADADRAVTRLRPQSVRSFTEPVTTAGWRTVPSSYIVCDRDQALEPSRQRELAGRAGSVHRLASSHSPFLSMPRQLATLLGRIAASPLPAPRR